MFINSRTKLADIYLEHLTDRRLFKNCYEEILVKFYNFENLKLAGDALMRIDSPDEAAEKYKKALEIKLAAKKG